MRRVSLIQIDMSGAMRSAMSPATPLRLTSLYQIACSEAGRAQHCPRTRFALSCAAILLCDLSRSAARALTSHTCRCGSLLASTRRTKLCKDFLPILGLVLQHDVSVSERALQPVSAQGAAGIRTPCPDCLY
jgi:hypothetical protein